MRSENSFKNCPECGGTGRIFRTEYKWIKEPDRFMYKTVHTTGPRGEIRLSSVPKFTLGRSYRKKQTVSVRCPSCNGTGKKR